jgi:hypothetical protein
MDMGDVVLAELIDLDGRIGALGNEPIPSQADELAMSLALHYLELTEAEQREVRGLVSDELGRYLLAFSGRLATLAVRRKDADALAAALALHALEDFQFDLRENLRVFALIGDACARIGVSVPELWPRVAAAFSDEHREHAEHATSPHAVETMGLRGVTRDGQFDYVPLR